MGGKNKLQGAVPRKRSGRYDQNGCGWPASAPMTVPKFSLMTINKNSLPPCQSANKYQEPATAAQVEITVIGLSRLRKVKFLFQQRNVRNVKLGSTNPSGPLAKVAKPKRTPRRIALIRLPPVLYCYQKKTNEQR